MKNAEGSLRLYRFQLVGAIGATFLLLGLISVEDLKQGDRGIERPAWAQLMTVSYWSRAA